MIKAPIIDVRFSWVRAKPKDLSPWSGLSSSLVGGFFCITLIVSGNGPSKNSRHSVADPVDAEPVDV